MKKFGKIQNGVFIEAPKSLKDSKFMYFNPKNEKYIEFGYQEVVSDQFPEDRSKNYRAVYKQKDGYILETWECIENELVSGSNDTSTSSLEDRIKLLEEQIEFLMEYGKFRKPWQEHKNS